MKPGQKIDWNAVRVKLAEGGRNLKKALEGDAQRKEAVYRQRAEQLAKRRPGTSTSAPTVSVLVFIINKERYGMDITLLAEVAPFTHVTPVPGAPPDVAGVANWRGEIRPVFHLAPILGDVSEEQNNTGGYILFLRPPAPEIGFRVDDVEGGRPVDPEALVPPSAAESGPAKNIIRGTTADGVMVLDLDSIYQHSIFKEG